MRDYSNIFRITPFEKDPNSYYIMRRKMWGKNYLVALAKVSPEHRYEIEAHEHLSPSETAYLEQEFRKIAKF